MSASLNITEKQLLNLLDYHTEDIYDDKHYTDFTLKVLKILSRADAFMDWDKIISYANKQELKDKPWRDRYEAKLRLCLVQS